MHAKLLCSLFILFYNYKTKFAGKLEKIRSARRKKMSQWDEEVSSFAQFCEFWVIFMRGDIPVIETFKHEKLPRTI